MDRDWFGRRRPAGVRAAVVAVIALMAGVACDEGVVDLPPSGPADIVSAQVVDTVGPIFRTLHVELEHASEIEVFYEPVDGGRTFRMVGPAAVQHDVLMPRLLEDTTYRFVARTFRAGESSDSLVRGTFTTGTVPDSIRELGLTVEGDASFGLLVIGTGGQYHGQVGVEPTGRVVWYHPLASSLAATGVPESHDLLFLHNGLFSDAGDGGIVRLRPDGSVAAALDGGSQPFGRIHHDLAALDQERVLFLATETRTIDGVEVTGEAIWQWNSATGAVQQQWSAFDFLDWNDDRGEGSEATNWLHANSIAVGPRGNTVVSFRRLNQIISIAPDFQSIEWRLGGPNATHGLREEDRFVGQHSAWELPAGRVLLFDNRGAGPLDDRSRALELELDGDSARMVWQYDPEPAIDAGLRSSVYRLANGNSVVTFAALPFTVDEVTPAGERVWRLTAEFGPFSRTFRAVPLRSIAGEERVESMP